MRLHLRPLGVRQTPAIHEKLLSELESQTSEPGNPKSQQTLEADRTLGGLCDWVEPEAPASVDLPIEGAAALKAAVITVVLHYTTTGPLA
jgi:hypothetical protein